MTKAWVILIAAGLLEVCWAVGLKYSKGLTRLGPSLFTLVTLAASMILLARAVERLPIGTAYPVWVGIGAAGAAVTGALLFQESISALRVFFLILLIASIFGLKLTSGQ